MRGIIAVALAFGLTPVAAHGQHVPTQPLAIAGLIVQAMIVGLAFALVVATVFAALSQPERSSTRSPDSASAA